MVKLYFVCMGNYYRSRLAEELALHYAAQYEVEIAADSGGLSKIPNQTNIGPIARETLRYLAEKDVTPRHANRLPKNCDWEAIAAADMVILTDDDEQRYLFVEQFPEHEAKLIGWHARDKKYDPGLRTLELIDIRTEELIKGLMK